jgi:hypothetical protein
MTAPASLPVSRAQVICALAVTLEDDDDLMSALPDALPGAAFDPATGVLSGLLWAGATFAAWLGPVVPLFSGRTLFLDLTEAGCCVRLARCLAPHELLPG